MFESTLEAQSLDHGEQRFGTLTAAALAHLGIGLAIVAATALIVPPVHPPEPPPPAFVVALGVSLDNVAPRLPVRPPPPKKGSDSTTARQNVAPPHAAPDSAPNRTQETLSQSTPSEAPPGPDGPDVGTPGDPNGSLIGVPGGSGDGDGVSGGGGLDPVEVTGDMVRPLLLVKVDPSYPQAARRAGLGGRVIVRAVIGDDGAVESVEVFASTNPLFNDAAVDAVRRWRYRPALMNGRPVRVYFTVQVDFLVR